MGQEFVCDFLFGIYTHILSSLKAQFEYTWQILTLFLFLLQHTIQGGVDDVVT